MTRSGRAGSAERREPGYEAFGAGDLAPASSRRAAMAGASNGELATMSARAPSSAAASSPRAAARKPGFRQVDREGEDRSAARIVGERQRAAHQADEPPGDREPEARSLETARVGAVALLEILEDRRAPVLRNAGTGVGHREAQIARPRRGSTDTQTPPRR